MYIVVSFLTGSIFLKLQSSAPFCTLQQSMQLKAKYKYTSLFTYYHTTDLISVTAWIKWKYVKSVWRTDLLSKQKSLRQRNVGTLFSRLSVPKECLHLTESGSLVSRLPAPPYFRSQFSRFVSQKVKEGEEIIRMREAVRQRGRNRGWRKRE